VSDVQPSHAKSKTPLEMLDGLHASKKFAGKLVRPEQLRQALLNVSAAEVLISGKLVRAKQLRHPSWKLVPAAVLISGKLVRLVQKDHAL